MTPADLVRDLARDVAVSWGMPWAADMLEVEEDATEVRIGIPCGDMVRRATMTIDDTLMSDLRSGGGRALDLRTRLSEMVRMQARAASVVGHDAERPPAWSVTVPRLFRDLLTASGLTPAMLVDRLDDYSGWEPADVGETVQLSAVSMRCGRILGTIALTAGSSPVSVLSTDDEDGACTVVIHDAELPGTALLAAEGWDLDDVVDHPALPGGGRHVVRHVTQRTSSGRTDLHLALEPDHAWCADAPADADVSWRRIREGRRLRLA